MTAPGTMVIKSTSDLTPDGILGYAKGVAVSLSAILVAVVEFLPESDYKRWTQIGIAVLGAIITIAAPNAVKPVTVPPPAVNVDPSADRAVPGTVLGVVDPPGEHAAPE
jgi:hypothetical protein